MHPYNSPILYPHYQYMKLSNYITDYAYPHFIGESQSGLVLCSLVVV